MENEVALLITESNKLLAQLNATLLFIVGVTAGVGVVFVLYKFLRKFF